MGDKLLVFRDEVFKVGVCVRVGVMINYNVVLCRDIINFVNERMVYEVGVVDVEV